MKRVITLLSLLIIGNFTYAQKLDFSKAKNLNPETIARHINLRTHQNIVRQKLDSLIFGDIEADSTAVPYGYFSFEYDQNGNNTLMIEKEYNSSQQLENVDKTAYTYNNDNLLSVLLKWSWENNQWVESHKIEYVYNSNQQLEFYTYYIWDSSNRIWKPRRRKQFTYDSAGNTIETIKKTFDTNSNSWNNVLRVTFQYDNNNLLTESITYDDINGTWVYHIKKENTYDSNQNLMEKVTYLWQSSDTLWQNFEKIENTYNTNNQLTREVSWNWDTNNNEWYPDERTDTDFDSYDNISTENYYDWNNSHWNPVWFSNFDYDNTYSYNDLLLPNFMLEFKEYFNHLLESVDDQYDWDEINGEWESQSYTYLYYSPVSINDITLEEQNQVQVFPNPTTGYIQIKLPEKIQEADIQLFDMQGRTVLKTKLSQAFNLNINNLKPGVYIIKIKSGNKIYSSQIIKK